MRQITVDFTSQTYPLFAGYLGEHNATELIAVKPVDMSGAMYSLAFMTNGEVIHSKYFSADEEIKVALWQQLTLDNDLYVQLEAYDDNGDYLGKSTTAKLVLSNSVHGTDMVADADNPDVYSEIAQNSAFRETLEDNVETLDKLTTSALGGLLFDGKPVGDSSGGGGISDELYQEIVANTEARHTHENKDILDKFGINTAKTRPTFNNGLTDEVIATQGDILSRVSPLQQTVPNSATVDGSTLKMQRKVGEAVTDLFSVELPENNVSGLTEEQAKNLMDCTNEKHSHENKAVLDLIGQEGENLTFNGKEITASASDSADFRVTAAQVAAELLRTNNVTIVSCKPSDAENNADYTNYFMDLIANTYFIFVPTENGELSCFSLETYDFTEKCNVQVGEMHIWYVDISSELSYYKKQGKEIRDILINGLESLS